MAKGTGTAPGVQAVMFTVHLCLLRVALLAFPASQAVLPVDIRPLPPLSCILA